MKIPNKQELQQISFNHSLDIKFKDFMSFYKKCTSKLYSILVIYGTLASDNLLRCRKNRFRKNIRTNHDNRWKTRDEKYNTILTETQQKCQVHEYE